MASKKVISVVPKVTFSVDQLKFSSNGGSTSFTYSLTSSVDESSIYFYVPNGSFFLSITRVVDVTKTVTISAETNSTSADREGLVLCNFQDKDGNEYSTYVGAIQYKGGIPSSAPSIDVYLNGQQISTLLVKQEGESDEMGISSHYVDEDTITVESDSSWIRIDRYCKDNFTYTILENKSLARNGKIIVSGKDTDSENYVYAYLNVSQGQGGEKPYVKFEKNEFKVGVDGYSQYDPSYNYMYFDYEYLDSNCGFHSDSNWVSFGSGSGEIYDDEGNLKDKGYVILHWDANGDTSPSRTATITLYGSNSSSSALATSTVKVIQDKGEHYVPSVGTISAPSQVYMGTWKGASNSFSFDTSNMSGNVSAVTNTDVITSMTIDNASKVVNFRISENTNSDTRGVAITLRGYDINGGYVATDVLVVQDAAPTVVEFPIWMDTDIEFEGDSTYVDYKISTEVSNELIYSGRVYFRNGKGSVRINDIMKQHIGETVSFDDEGLQDNGAYISAILSISFDGENYAEYRRIKCYNDWSYVDDYKTFLSNPIRYEVDPRQYLLCSVIDHYDEFPTIMFTTVNSEGGKRNMTYALANQIGTLVRRVNYASEVQVSIGDETMDYKAIEGCYRWCLYYKNDNGGYDSFIFKGKCTRTDNVENFNYKRNVSNLEVLHNDVQYMRKITPSWSLTSDYMTDDETVRFANIVHSNQAYLHDLENDVIYPINVQTSSYEYKTFRGNGRKFFTNTITVQLAQDRIVK